MYYFLKKNYGVEIQDLKPQTFRNAYDVPRRNLMDQLTRMKYNFLRNACQSLKLKRQDEGGLSSVCVCVFLNASCLVLYPRHVQHHRDLSFAMLVTVDHVAFPLALAVLLNKSPGMGGCTWVS